MKLAATFFLLIFTSAYAQNESIDETPKNLLVMQDQTVGHKTVRCVTYRNEGLSLEDFSRGLDPESRSNPTFRSLDQDRQVQGEITCRSSANGVTFVEVKEYLRLQISK